MKVCIGEDGSYPVAYFLSSSPYISVFCVTVLEDGSFSCDCSGFKIKGSCHHYHLTLQKLLDKEWSISSAPLHDAYVVTDAAG